MQSIIGICFENILILAPSQELLGGELAQDSVLITRVP